MGHSFIMVVSEDPWHSHLMPNVSSRGVTTSFNNLDLSRLRFEHSTFCLRGERSNLLRHHRGTQYVKGFATNLRPPKYVLFKLILPVFKTKIAYLFWLSHYIFPVTKSVLIFFKTIFPLFVVEFIFSLQRQKPSMCIQFYLYVGHGTWRCCLWIQSWQYHKSPILRSW